MPYNNSIIKYPDMALVKQRLYKSGINDLSTKILSTLSSLPIVNTIKSEETVAVAVGSRNINQIDRIVYYCLDYLKKRGLKPFIIPAMGSHGGATSDGQRNVLAKFGITEAAMGVPVISDMDVECISEVPKGPKIYISKTALKADHIVIINRIKNHTKFRADIESGLCKMLSIGLGKAKGAAEFHQCAIKNSFRIIEDAAKTIINKCNILFGIALLEDGFGDLAHVEAILPSSIIEREKILLKDAAAMMGHIPFDPIDILIIDYIGKDISGIGMDSNITGRHRDILGDFYTAPHVKRIFVRELSPDSDGNGHGIGLADITTKRLVDALDLRKTYTNAITAISPEKAAIPIHFDTDREALDVCTKTIGLDSMEDARIVRIKDTATLELLQVSKALLPDILSNPNLKQITEWTPFQFDNNYNLPELSSLLSYRLSDN